MKRARLTADPQYSLDWVRFRVPVSRFQDRFHRADAGSRLEVVAKNPC